MKKLILGLTVSLFSIAVQSTEINSGQGTTNKETLNGYRSFELGEAIFLLMPDKNMEYVGWDFRSDAPVLWMTDGYKTEKNHLDKEISFRDGLMRVNVQGTESYILRKKKEELAWTIRFLTFSNPKFGVDSINLYPGDSDGICFGELYENCDFKIEKSLESVNVNIKKVCEQKFSGNYKRVGYELSHRDKKNVFAELMYDGGSGGSSTSFEIFLHKKAKSLCKDDDEEDSSAKDSKVVVEKPKKSVKTTSKQNDLGICENFSGLAKSVMEARQRGASMSEVMKLAEGNKITESLIITAYGRPSFSSEIYQEKAVREYQDETYLSCIKTLRQ